MTNDHNLTKFTKMLLGGRWGRVFIRTYRYFK